MVTPNPDVMLDALAAHHLSKDGTKPKPDTTEIVVMAIVMLLVFAVWIAAVARARGERELSPTSSADVLFAWTTPLSYWVLHFCGVLGVAKS